MNEQTTSRRVTQAAEGLPRWRWTTAELDRMLAAGVLREDDRVELIGGELVPMSPKGPLHEAIKLAVIRWLRRDLSEDLDFLVELGWRPDDETYCEPDILVLPRRASPSRVAAADVLLAIEIADSSEDYDLGAKALIYARLGIRDYWAIRGSTLATRVHRDPGPEGYRTARDVAPSDVLAALLLPDLKVRLVDLSIDRDA